MTKGTHASKLLVAAACAVALSVAACGGAEVEDPSLDPDDQAAIDEVLANDDRFAVGPLDETEQAELCEAVASHVSPGLTAVPNQNGACWIEGLESVTVSIEAKGLTEEDMEAVPLLIAETDGQADVCEVVGASHAFSEEFTGNVEEIDAGEYCRVESGAEDVATAGFVDARHAFVVQSTSCALPCPQADPADIAEAALEDTMPLLLDELAALRG